MYASPNLISWSSKKQHAISKSIVEVEYHSHTFLVANLFWIRIRNLCDELQIPLSTTPMVYCDNLSVVVLAANPILHSESKHFELALHFVQTHVAKGRV